MSADHAARQLGVLALGTFAIGTDGFVIAGVLPGIARDMHVTLAAAGLLVTAFALAYAVGAPLLTAAAARAERRGVLVAGMVVLAVANAAGAVGHGYGWIMAARVGAAIGAALYSPIALATAVQLSKPAARGRAISVVLGGMTASLVTGVPVGAFLGALGSWRWTLWFVAVIAAASAAGIAVLLPRVPAAPVSSLRARIALLKRAAIAANLAATFLWITGAFALYTFIAALLSAATGWQGAPVSALLLAYGVAAFAGNAAGGRMADRWGATRSIAMALTSLMLSMSALGWAAHIGPPAGRLVAIASVIAWPAAGWSLTPAQSHRLVGLAPAAGPEVLSLNTSAVYLGIAAGAALGGVIIRHLDVAWLGPAAAALQLLALTIVLSAETRPAPAAPVVPAATDPVSR